MNKPILFVDCDDTIENFCEVWNNKLNEIYNTNHKVEDYTDWNISSLFPTISKKELLSVINEPEFWEKVKPFYHAQSALLILSKMTNLYLISAGTYESMLWKVEKVLKKYFWFVPEDHYISLKDRWLINTDYIVDDNFETIIKSNCSKKYLMDAPHNRKFKVEDFYTRVYNWDEILTLILKDINKNFKEIY